jgi:hypothetical protein
MTDPRFCSLNVYDQHRVKFVIYGLKKALERAKIENKMVFIDTFDK